MSPGRRPARWDDLVGLALGVLMTALFVVGGVAGVDSRELDDRDRRRWFPHEIER
jgi:hypothetical protein